MAESRTYLAVFDDIEPAANGIDKLHELGVRDRDMNVISGIPVRPSILERPPAVTRVSTIGFIGALLGMGFGVFLVWGTPFLFPLLVGGQPIYPVPQVLIITFEMTMLGLMLSSFLGMFVDSGFPSYTPKEYLPEISDGKIGVLYSTSTDEERKIADALKEAGAESVEPAEARQL
jgi:hypothetical protein